jgi:hypothetical protein
MTFEQKLQNLYEEARICINRNIDEKSEDSSHLGHHKLKVIKIKEGDLMFNLEGGRYLTELSQDSLIDNNGYAYAYGQLDYEELCLLADYVENL